VAGSFAPERVPTHFIDSSSGQELKIYFTEQKRNIVGIMTQNLIKNIYHSLKVIYHSLKLRANSKKNVYHESRGANSAGADSNGGETGGICY